MRPLPPKPNQPRKKLKKPEMNWVLEYDLVPKFTRKMEGYTLRTNRLHNRYATEKSALEAKEALERGGMWRKEIWDIENVVVREIKK